jgi:hypothetical protein
MNLTCIARISPILCMGVLSIMLQSTCIAGGVLEEMEITGGGVEMATDTLQQ